MRDTRKSLLGVLVATVFVVYPAIGKTSQADWETFISHEYHISLKHPKGWKEFPNYQDRYGSDDGFFQFNAMRASSAMEACKHDAYHKLRPYGSRPRIEKLLIHGREACLITPSLGQDESEKGIAEIVIKYPTAVTINGYEYNFLALYADKKHIRQISQTLKFVYP